TCLYSSSLSFYCPSAHLHLHSFPTRRSSDLTGGNLAVILDKTAALARERARLRGQLNIYTAQGRITGWILCIAPFIMFGLISLVNWTYEKTLFTEPLGLKIIYFGMAMMVIGILVIRKIIDIKI